MSLVEKKQVLNFFLVFTGFIVDVTGDYRYMFLMCGAVMSAGGIFLLVMNFYNYHMLEREQRKNAAENGDQVEMKRSPEAEKEQTGPEATVQP